MNKVISIVTILVFLGSSIGIHIIHHDDECCGTPDEILSFVEFINHEESSCCSDTEVHDCIESQDAVGSCEDHSHHNADCCSHEVFILKDTFNHVESENEFDVYSIELDIRIISTRTLEYHSDMHNDIAPPPPLKLPKYTLALLSSFRC